MEYFGGNTEGAGGGVSLGSLGKIWKGKTRKLVARRESGGGMSVK